MQTISVFEVIKKYFYATSIIVPWLYYITEKQRQIVKNDKDKDI